MFSQNSGNPAIYTSVTTTLKSVDHSIYVSGFSCSCLYLCDQCGAFWVQMLPVVLTNVGYSFNGSVTFSLISLTDNERNTSVGVREFSFYVLSLS